MFKTNVFSTSECRESKGRLPKHNKGQLAENNENIQSMKSFQSLLENFNVESK